MPKTTTETGPALLRAWLNKAGDGAVSRLAEGLGVTRAAVHYWLSGTTVPTRPRAADIEKATDGAVPRGAW